MKRRTFEEDMRGRYPAEDLEPLLVKEFETGREAYFMWELPLKRKFKEFRAGSEYRHRDGTGGPNSTETFNRDVLGVWTDK